MPLYPPNTCDLVQASPHLAQLLLRLNFNEFFLQARSCLRHAASALRLDRGSLQLPPSRSNPQIVKKKPECFVVQARDDGTAQS